MSELNTRLSDCADDDAACSEACVAATAEAEFEKLQVAIECIVRIVPMAVSPVSELGGPQVSVWVLLRFGWSRNVGL